MDAPKISVIVPMYNRRHYIAQCLDSALNQTFREDYEIIVRDDCSNDGSADFVEQRYAKEISSGKIKLRRNEKNLGEFPNENSLLRETTGKYIMILHSDDMYLPHAMKHMYEVAEHFHADVVHECRHFKSAPDGTIDEKTPLQINYYDRNQVKKITVMPNDPFFRFNMWIKDIGIDAHHNIFNRKFFMENDLRFESFGGSLTGGNRLLALKWLMKAKVLIKTHVPFYVYRLAPDSGTNAAVPPERVARFITAQIQLSRHLDEFFAVEDFFKDNPAIQYATRSTLFAAYDNHRIINRGVYKDGITPELHSAVEETFRKYFGDDAAFPTFLFHWIHAAMFGKSVNVITPPHSIKRGLKKFILRRKLRRRIFFAIMTKNFLQ